jgi:putative transposase
MKYAFIRAHWAEFGVRAMCRVLRVHFSGFHAWLEEPLSRRAQDDARQTKLIRRAGSGSGKVYGYRKLADDLRDQGEQGARLASLAGILAQIGYKRRPGRYGGKPAVVAPNTLDRQFEVDAPDKVWATDVTDIKTHEGWLYLSVVIDLFSRRVVGWSAGHVVELYGELAAILNLAGSPNDKTRRVKGGVSGSLVAGTGFEPVTFRL